MANLTLAALRGQLRGILLDEVAPYQWPDGALDQAVQEAVAEHSYLFPQQTTLLFTLTSTTQAIALYPVDFLATGVPADPATAPNQADLIAVQRVELPPGTPIPPDVDRATDPAFSGSTQYSQAWRWRGNFLYLRNPPAGAEIGPNQLRVDILQTYSQPDAANVIAWNGPAHDLPLLLLLAKRAAYALLGEWQARDGAGQAPLGGGPAVGWLAPVVAATETEIARAVRVRQGRAVRSRTLDI